MPWCQKICLINTLSGLGPDDKFDLLATHRDWATQS
ncbi:hypothetical protein EDD25_1579 [Cryobacterium psychrophilum]|nr:hypothetical protein EDD25_1579 [Cryobacterium psychrophilum]